MPVLYGEVEKTSGEVDFLGKDIVFKNIKGSQEGTWGYAHGKTEIHNNALTHFYLHIPEVSLVLAKHYIDNSPSDHLLNGSIIIYLLLLPDIQGC